jgi:non-ribosomal peptide synthetase component E (peptide arylation enzyme)
MVVDGLRSYQTEDAERYKRLRWWPGLAWGDLIDRASDLYPRTQGLSDDTHTFSYAELRQNVDRLAVSLLGLGVNE